MVTAIGLDLHVAAVSQARADSALGLGGLGAADDTVQGNGRVGIARDR